MINWQKLPALTVTHAPMCNVISLILGRTQDPCILLQKNWFLPSLPFFNYYCLSSVAECVLGVTISGSPWFPWLSVLVHGLSFSIQCYELFKTKPMCSLFVQYLTLWYFNFIQFLNYTAVSITHSFNQFSKLHEMCLVPLPLLLSDTFPIISTSPTGI